MKGDNGRAVTRIAQMPTQTLVVPCSVWTPSTPGYGWERRCSWGRRVREVRALAHKMLGEPAVSTSEPAPAPTPKSAPTPEPHSVPTPMKLGLWTAIVAAAGGVTHWLGDHVLLTITAVIAAAIVASFLVFNPKNGD
jgi:hypothetical protein